MPKSAEHPINQQRFRIPLLPAARSSQLYVEPAPAQELIWQTDIERNAGSSVGDPFIARNSRESFLNAFSDSSPPVMA
jgi:hypothetical protein